jgi:hypothetical protein
MAQFRITDDNIVEGELTFDLLEQMYPWMHSVAAEYEIDSSHLAYIKQHAANLRFIVILGTWCSDSRELIPVFAKICKQAGILDSQITLIGTLRNKTCSLINISPFNIEYVPTFYVIYESKTIGSIVEQPDGYSFEEDLAGIIKSQF